MLHQIIWGAGRTKRGGERNRHCFIRQQWLPPYLCFNSNLEQVENEDFAGMGSKAIRNIVHSFCPLIEVHTNVSLLEGMMMAMSGGTTSK